MSAHDHHKGSKRSLRVGVITVSDTRTADNDDSGRVIREAMAAAGHLIAHYQIVRDEPDQIAATVSAWIADLDAIVINGGTGISLRDSTFEAVEGLLDKKLEGFGELFRMLSYHEIGSAAFLSRATAGVCRGKILVSIPGSPSACRLAMEKLLIPELGHIGELLKL
ncbi:MAG TPA: molybdenum cofactor biosynthesis protein B [Candidatus Binataceae bacterium]